MSVTFDPDSLSLHAAGITLADLAPIIDGRQLDCTPPEITTTPAGWCVNWQCKDGGTSLSLLVTLQIRRLPHGPGFGPTSGPESGTGLRPGLRLDLAIESARSDLRPHSIGLRIGATEGALHYLRNGYTSWDGSYFVDPVAAVNKPTAATPGPDTAAAACAPAPPGAHIPAAALTGYAMTALLSGSDQACVLGFLRHDRFQNRLRFAFADGPLSFDVETLTDAVAHDGRIQAEPLILLAGSGVEETLRTWARHVAAESPLPPRIREKRITGWCSWYSLYNSIGETVLLEHLHAAARFRDSYRVPFEVFQIDDGFTPEMGDWLELKPQFPRGMAPLLSDIHAAGFVPGLWIAPFMVGNRSQLYAAHPDWVVTDRASGKPLAPMKFYGEFRWHKRSEEYYILDITHPEAGAYIRNVFRVWTRDWGCRYFKTDFMYFGSEYGPEQARWHQPGLSRMAIWMRMAQLIRDEIGDSLWLGCGGPIWAPLGLMDAVRIGRDIGVSWAGHHSAESLLRDQTARNFANGIFWQADPDCILLRNRFHDLTAGEVRSLALFAGLSGGLLMTSDQLDEVSEERRQLLAQLIGDGAARPCDFPQLGRGDSVLLQQVTDAAGAVRVNVFNTGDQSAERAVPGRDAPVSLAPHESQVLTIK